MTITLYECFKEMYEDALKEVSERLKNEALTHREISDILQKRVSRFESYYAEQNIEPFTDEMVSRVWEDFLKLVEDRLKVHPQVRRISFTLPGLSTIFEHQITFYSYCDALIKNKIDFIINTDPTAYF